MAEEQIYEEQIADGGDPSDPLGLRKKSKGKVDPLGLRKKSIAAATPKQFNVVVEQPSFKPKPATGPVREMSMQRDLSKPETATFNVGGQLKQVDLGVEKTRAKALDAQQKITKELLENDDVIESTIRKERYDAANQQRLAQQERQMQSDMPSVQSPAMLVDPRISSSIQPQEEIVTPQDILKVKMSMTEDPLKARNILERVAEQKPEKSKEIQKAIYQIDVANSLGDDEDSGRRITQIEKNIEDIGKGDVVYDMRTGRLIKPENFIQSVVTGWKNKTRLFEDYDKFKNTQNNEALAMDLNFRRVADPDKPQPVPASMFAEIGSMIGGTPAKALAGGALGSLAGPEGGIAAGSIIGGREFAKLEYANTFQRIYYELKDQGVPEYEAIEQARFQANQAAEVGAITGAAMGLVGGRIGMRPLPKAVLNEGFRKAVMSGAKNLGGALSKATKEGLALGGVAGAGEMYKNSLAQDAGIDRQVDEGVLEHVESMLLFSLGLAAATKGANAFSPKVYRTLMNGLSKANQEHVGNALQGMIDNGQITIEQAAKTMQDIVDYKNKDAAIPETVAPEARVEIQDFIERRGNLEKRLETEDKAFHPEIKEKIKVIDEQIVEKSKTKADKAPKEETDLKKFVDEQIEEGNIQGFTKDVLASAHLEELPGFFKEIADQANDPNSANMTLQTYGEALVNKAKQMYPVKPRVTVSTPGIRNVRAKEGAFPEYKVTFEQGIGAGDITQGKELIASGSESTVYRDGDTVIKISEPYNDPFTFNARVEDAKIINDVLGDGSLEVIGVHKSKNGTPNPIFRQKFVEGEKATPEQIDAYMESKGFEKKGNGYENEQYRFTDIDADNAIVDANGQVHIIDAGVEKLKPKSDAVPQRISEEVSFSETSQPSREVGEGIPKPEEPTGTRPQEESQNTGQEGQVGGEAPMTGITHAKMDEMSRRLGFEEYEKSPERQTEWIQQAEKRIADNPNAINDLLNKMRNGGIPDAVEQKMMGIYVADLEAKLAKDPLNDTIIADLKRAKDLSNIAGGRLAGQSLVARKGLFPTEETLGDYYEQQQQTSGVGKLTEKQKETNLREFEEFQKAQRNWDAYNAKRIDELATKKAEEKVKQIKTEVSKSKRERKDYAQERQEIFQSIKDKLKEARKDTSVTAVPYAKELIAIAPEVAKLVRNLVEQGAEKLPEVISAVHSQLKDVIEQITPEDVRALIAGEYSDNARAKNEITAKVRDLKDQASLIGKLQALQAGVEPKNEKQRIKRNKEIEDLKKQIKEHDLTKLAQTKERLRKELAKLEMQLRNIDVKEEPKKDIPLDEEGRRLKDLVIKARKDRQIRLAEEEFANRPLGTKIKDWALIPIREMRTIQSSFDYSMPLRQGLVPTAAELLTNPKKTLQRTQKMFVASANPKFFDRYIHDLKNSPDYRLMEDSGLAITEPGKFDKKEEVFQSRYVEKIPIFGTIGIKGSERAAAFWLNDQRVNLFRQGVERMEQNGRTFQNSPELYKQWASAVNSLTGKGELVGPLKNASELLSVGLFSPKLMASRLAFFNPKFYWKIPKELRVKMAGDMAKFIGLGVAVLSLGKMFGADTEADPRSPEFGKLRVGDTRYDIWGGLQQYVRLFSQLLTMSKKSSSGQVSSLWEQNTKGERQLPNTLLTFLRSKSSPVAGTIWDIAAGENIVGEPVTLKSEAKKMLPLILKDMLEAASKEGPTGAAKTLPALFGVGVQTYNPADNPSKSSGGGGKRTNRRTQNRRKPRTQNR